MKSVIPMTAAVLLGSILLVLVQLSSGLHLSILPLSEVIVPVVSPSAPTSLVTCREEIVEYKEETIVPVLDGLVESLELSRTMSRLPLATTVESIQAVQQQLTEMEPDDCATSMHLLFVETTQSILNGYLSFAANDLTESALHLDRANELLELIRSTTANANNAKT